MGREYISNGLKMYENKKIGIYNFKKYNILAIPSTCHVTAVCLQKTSIIPHVNSGGGGYWFHSVRRPSARTSVDEIVNICTVGITFNEQDFCSFLVWK